MFKKVLTVLLIEDSQEYADLVQRWLAPQDGIEFVLNWCDSLTDGLTRLAKGGIDAVLLDLGLGDSEGFETFTTVRAQAAGVPIVILSGGDTESLALKMVQQGAQDYIIKTACDSQILIKAVQFAVGRSSHHTADSIGSDPRTVIGVMGAKGGVGATTFACNLAIELRRQTLQDTLLADLDVNAGLVSFHMKTAGGYNILDAAANITRLDHSLWKDAVAHVEGGLDVVPSPDLLGADHPNVRKIQDVIPLIHMFYRWTVLDLGRLNSLSVSLLDRVSELYLVTMMSVPALYEAKRTIGVLMNAGLEADRLRLIVNQVGAAEEISGSELRRLFGVPVYANLPAAARELDDASLKGTFLDEKSAYRAQVADLARKIAGLPIASSEGPVSQLRLFADKFLRSKKDAAPATRV